MLKKIEVIGLYDTFSHPIELKNENVTLILGENGLGKTLILKMINAFFSKEFNELYSYNFEKFILTFIDDTIIYIKKSDNIEESSLTITRNKEFISSKNKNDKIEIPIIDYSRRGRNIRMHREKDYRYRDYKYREYYDELEFHFKNFIPYPIERVGVDKWYDARSEIVITTSGLLERYKDYIPIELINKYEKVLPDWLIEKIDSINPIFIETQRLLIKGDEREYRSSVLKYSQELAETIKNKTVIATDLGSKLDKSFPNRVIKQITHKNPITDNEIEEGLNRLSQKRVLLNKVGLIDTNEEEDLDPYTYTRETRQTQNKNLLRDVLQVYISDSNEKLVIYDELAEKLELLINIINKRFLYKEMAIDKKAGFIFKSTITQKPIPLSGLSSGEQHELVLFYQLLFNTIPDSLLLIDEPEISLHVTWQNHFIEDLRDVIKLNNFSAIIATHSPDIINNNWHLSIQLKGV